MSMYLRVYFSAVIGTHTHRTDVFLEAEWPNVMPSNGLLVTGPL